MNLLEPFKISQFASGYNTGVIEKHASGLVIDVNSPVDGALIGTVSTATIEDLNEMVAIGQKAFLEWRKIPAPIRGKTVRVLGNKLREFKNPLANLVSYEMGKSLQESLGEVQEMIDICDYAVGMSRQLYGLQMHSERPNHRMMEQWHPLGIVGIISAFNFPVAVWAWNAAISLICGNVCLWKPSEKTPFTALACQYIFSLVIKEQNLPEGISSVIIGDRVIGEAMAKHIKIPLISATGSTRMGRLVGIHVAERFGKSILELGGNNAIIVSEHADIKQTIPAIVFGAVGTAGQRCTSTRRLIVQASIYQELKQKLIATYNQIRIGDPLDEKNHMGPLIDKAAVSEYSNAIMKASNEGGVVLCGDKILEGSAFISGCYVRPTIIEATVDMNMIQNETFAPILYLLKYDTLEEAIEIQNSVSQGLSSSIFTLNSRESEFFLSNLGSDCGIANVNIGTSGAEIGGAFGGEKETGGGRESGSDAWKSYMRRQTCTLNYSTELPLAQGIKFDI